MRITFVTDLGQTYTIEIDPQMELENIMALLEAESGIPAADQSISFQGRELSDPKATMAGLGVEDEAMLVFRRKVVVAGRSAAQDAEMMRLQILGNPTLMAELRDTQPELADAVANHPERFAQLLRQQQARQQAAESSRKQEIEALNADPFDVEAQRRIEEAIRQQAVMENLEHAMEYSPESFGRVHMLYIPVEVNSIPVKAFVDSGAQQTIMSPHCAERCGIMRLLDTRFSGIAKGVGTAKILGRIHSAQLKVHDLHLACSFTVMEGRDVDLLFGLDMLKAHQAIIDLEKNVLRIQGREIPFLPEHEIPNPEDFGGEPVAELEDGNARNNPSGPSGSSDGPQRPFPGSGNTLGRSPASSPARAATPKYPEADIVALVGLGATRELAISLLDQTGGNLDMAASALFS